MELLLSQQGSCCSYLTCLPAAEPALSTIQSTLRVQCEDMTKGLFLVLLLILIVARIQAKASRRKATTASARVHRSRINNARDDDDDEERSSVGRSKANKKASKGYTRRKGQKTKWDKQNKASVDNLNTFNYAVSL